MVYCVGFEQKSIFHDQTIKICSATIFYKMYLVFLQSQNFESVGLRYLLSLSNGGGVCYVTVSMQSSRLGNCPAELSTRKLKYP